MTKKTKDAVQITEVLNSNPNFIPSQFNSLKEFKEAKARLNKKEPTAEEVQYFQKLKLVPEETKQADLSIDKICWLIVKRGSKLLGREFIVDKINKPIIKLLSLYFSNNPEFENSGDGYSLQKGILFRGDVGIGKTVLLKLFANHSWVDGYSFNSGYTFQRFVSCKQVEREYLKHGLKAIELFTRPDFKEAGEVKPKIYVFDDLGSENATAKNFGNNINVMEEIISDRYELFCETRLKTHLTTNLVNYQQTEDIYGERIVSRLREMCNVITVNGTDRRK